MQTELARMREILRNALPEKAFLKRDRGDALFITNAPIFHPAVEAIPGFILIPEGKLLRILPDAGWLVPLEQSEAPDQLSASLSRFRDAQPDAENLRLFAQGLKLLDMDASAVPNEIEAFDRALRQRAALALRGACSGGGLRACALILHHLNHQIHKGE